jgi:hypothetical protein
MAFDPLGVKGATQIQDFEQFHPLFNKVVFPQKRKKKKKNFDS